MEYVDILGTVAGFTTTLIFLPQVIKTWKEKSAKDVSLWMFLFAIANQALWIGYGFMRPDNVIIFTNIAMMLLAFIMIYFKFKFK